jgi:ATP-dependent Clp protease ATP-binding subunit ClpA
MDADGPVKAALDDCGVTREAVRAGVESGSGRLSEPATSPRLREVLEQSLREAVERGDARLVDVEHLLLAVLHETEGRGQKALVACGRSPRAVERRLGRALRAQLSGSSSSSS